jgi:hypothetical protein
MRHGVVSSRFNYRIRTFASSNENQSRWELTFARVSPPTLINSQSTFIDFELVQRLVRVDMMGVCARLTIHENR